MWIDACKNRYFGTPRTTKNLLVSISFLAYAPQYHHTTRLPWGMSCWLRNNHTRCEKTARGAWEAPWFLQDASLSKVKNHRLNPSCALRYCICVGEALEECASGTGAQTFAGTSHCSQPSDFTQTVTSWDAAGTGWAQGNREASLLSWDISRLTRMYHSSEKILRYLVCFTVFGNLLPTSFTEGEKSFVAQLSHSNPKGSPSHEEVQLVSIV